LKINVSASHNKYCEEEIMGSVNSETFEKS